MKRIYYAQITGPDYNRQMGEIMEAEYGSEWDGDVAAYLTNLDVMDTEVEGKLYSYREGPENIPGDVQQAFTDSPENICVVFWGDDAREIYWAQDVEE